jgi:hypothetical protein
MNAKITFTHVPPSSIIEEFADYVTDDLMPLLEKCADCYIDDDTDFLVVDGQPIIPISRNAIENRRCIGSIRMTDASSAVIRAARGFFKGYVTVEY